MSGQLNGQCSVWDVRAGESPVSTTPREICHRESANRVLWINSKTNTEFFSGGADGQVIWWDTRKLTERLESLYMDPEKSDEQVLERSHGVSVLEYEHTIPTRFMVGSEQGMLYFCNRKGKTPMEKITLRVSREFTQFSCDGHVECLVLVCYKWLTHSPHLYSSSHLIRNALWPFFPLFWSLYQYCPFIRASTWRSGSGRSSFWFSCAPFLLLSRIWS